MQHIIALRKYYANKISTHQRRSANNNRNHNNKNHINVYKKNFFNCNLFLIAIAKKLKN